MSVPGEPHDDLLAELHADEVERLPAGTLWFDAHTHMGHNDPDGFEADPEEIVAGLDRAGQDRALIFAMHEPTGYPRANDQVLEACFASGGRLEALARIDPNAPDALGEAQRCLDAGARGFKLHPRSDAFGLPHPVVEDIVELAGSRRAPVLFHAGRGMPHLGEAVVDMARAHPDARLILAHAGISEVGWIAPYAAELPNVLFDTAWWQVADMLALFTTIPPGQILYASDMPYGSPRFHALNALRCARAAGVGEEARAIMAGTQLQRVLDGDDLLELGPPPGADDLGARDVAYERIVTYLGLAAYLSYRELPEEEPLALAALACQRPDSSVLVRRIAELIEAGRAAAAREEHELVGTAALAGQLLAGTHALGL